MAKSNKREEITYNFQENSTFYTSLAYYYTYCKYFKCISLVSLRIQVIGDILVTKNNLIRVA